MKKYIVSIYRGEKDKPHSLVGVVEKVGEKGKMAFTNLDELWEILNPVKDELKQSKKVKLLLTVNTELKKGVKCE